MELQGHERTADSEREMSIANLAEDVVGLPGTLGAPAASGAGLA